MTHTANKNAAPKSPTYHNVYHTFGSIIYGALNNEARKTRGSAPQTYRQDPTPDLDG